ncbi:uncharacterized protein [Triticum aestivum]|uniref:uncharacterized protein isoform X2 n=1 Tax=Triticum aestivum TaxID=4565 RepID=UPI001D00DCF7|nr:uncharacterized protein LOC123060117 isoform X2 [Triticum aestivum]
MTPFQQAVLGYLKKCGIRYSVTKGGKKQDCTHEPEFQSVHNTKRKDWGERYPPSVGLNHAQPTPEAISRFNTNLLACEGVILKKKWVKHYHPILAVLSGQDIKDELTPGCEMTMNTWRCVQRMLWEKDNGIYKGWLDRFRGVFDPKFVEEVCRDDGETDWDYIDTMMNSEVNGYRIDWLKKFWFPVDFMDCWSMYLLDKDEKTVMVLDPTETDAMDEMRVKHESRAMKFQRRFCSLFNNFFSSGLVDIEGWKFLYPLVAQHDPCSREDSGVYIAHYYTDFMGLYLRSTLCKKQIDDLRGKLAYEVVAMKGNKGDIPEFLYDVIID